MSLTRRSLLKAAAATTLVAALPEATPELVQVEESWTLYPSGMWVWRLMSGSTVLTTEWHEQAPFATWGPEKIERATFQRFMPEQTFRRMFGDA